MKAAQLQSYRLPTGELVLHGPVAEFSERGILSELMGSLFRHEIVGFAFSLISALSTLWVLAG